MSGTSHPAAVLRAAAKARALQGRPVVVKFGGSAMEDPAAARGTLECVVALQTLGVRQIIVHGGGKPIDRAMQEAGIEPVKVQGRRYTDDRTLGIVVRVLHDICRGLVKQIDELGGVAFAFDAADKHPLYGERLLLPGLDLQPIDLGRVGKVTRVDGPALHAVMTEYFQSHFPYPDIPVVPSLALDADGGWLNVNADTAAAAVAGAAGAESVLFLTDTAGVLWDRNDPTSRFARLTRHQCNELISTGVIQGGMIPKVEACLDALDAGADRAVILDGRDPHALLSDFASDRPCGTEIVT